MSTAARAATPNQENPMTTSTAARPAPRPAPRRNPTNAALLDLSGHHLVAPERLAQLRAIEAAAAELVRKLDEHQRRGYDHIRLGALRPLADALTTGGAR